MATLSFSLLTGSKKNREGIYVGPLTGSYKDATHSWNLTPFDGLSLDGRSGLVLSLSNKNSDIIRLGAK